MVDHALLHSELAVLASRATGNFDLNEALHQLSLTAAAALGVEGAGVTLRMPGGRTEYLTATDAVTLHVEKKQDALQQGACVDAIESSEIVAVDDLEADQRWPDFAPFVLQAGFRAAAGVPIASQGRNVGALDLYATSSHAWTTEEFTAARVLADLAAGYLINTHLLGQAQTLAEQLQHALDSRVIIEQAKGALAARHGMTPDAAFEVMRSYARGGRTKLHEVASGVIAGHVDPMGGAFGSEQDSLASS